MLVGVNLGDRAPQTRFLIAVANVGTLSQLRSMKRKNKGLREPMIPTRQTKALLGSCFVLLIAWGGAAYGQASKTFTGKISEIAKGTQLDMGKSDIFYTLRLDEYPKIQFRLSLDDAVRYGVIENAGTTAILIPRMKKGLGWKVKLTCEAIDFEGFKASVYKVTSLVRLND